MGVLGFDTSNYTTSAACFDGETGMSVRKLLPVPPGELGLRQSEALFHHVRQLPALLAQLEAEGLPSLIQAVGASTRPRAVEGSYMPCFLAGASQGECLAHALGVPFFPCSHQQGHLAAAAWSAGELQLLEGRFLAWHLSGGTTELLLVEPEGTELRAQRIGGSTDLSAGQLIDRCGVQLGLPFPAGRALDALAEDCGGEEFFGVKCRGLDFSLSGMENQFLRRLEEGWEPGRVARFVLLSVAEAVRRCTLAAQAQYPGLPVLCSGGVASNRLLRQRLPQARFAAPEYSTDNAMGVAVLTQRALAHREDTHAN